MQRASRPGHLRGFTLIEAIVVIVITGILGAIVAIFIRAPVEAYLITGRRAEMVDAADTSLRRIARDVRLALPNSVRVSGGGNYVELIPVVTGGRYRFNDDCFSATTCSSLSTIGETINSHVAPSSTPSPALPANTQLAIYNQYNNSGADCSVAGGIFSAYCDDGVRTVTANTPAAWPSTGPNTVADTFSFAPFRFRPDNGSPSRRFFLIAASPVTFACDTATGTLWRISGYTRQAVQPTNVAAAPLGTASSRSRLATNVVCGGGALPTTFSYAAGATERFGLFTAWLTVRQNSEDISLMHQVHVDNTP